MSTRELERVEVMGELAVGSWSCIFNELRMGTFLSSFDNLPYRALTFPSNSPRLKSLLSCSCPPEGFPLRLGRDTLTRASRTQ